MTYMDVQFVREIFESEDPVLGLGLGLGSGSLKIYTDVGLSLPKQLAFAFLSLLISPIYGKLIRSIFMVLKCSSSVLECVVVVSVLRFEVFDICHQ